MFYCCLNVLCIAFYFLPFLFPCSLSYLNYSMYSSSLFPLSRYVPTVPFSPVFRFSLPFSPCSAVTFLIFLSSFHVPFISLLFFIVSLVSHVCFLFFVHFNTFLIRLINPVILQDRKWPNNYLKSPGIKIRNKAMPNPLPPRPHPCPNEGGHLSKGMLEGDEVSVSGMAGVSGGGSERGTPTPTSPNTPITLPAIQQTQQLHQDQQQQQHSATADTAIFCPVEIPAFSKCSCMLLVTQ